MARFFKEREENRGLAPGSLVFIGDKKVDNTRIRLIDYDQDALREEDLQSIEQGSELKETETVTWINIYGLHDVDLIQEVGDTFELHPLILEDILNTAQRPKLEEFDNCLFLVMKMLRYDESTKRIDAEQLSIVISDKFLITFQEKPGDVFEPVRDRIRKMRGRIRSSGVDYLAYALLDTVVDNYIYVIANLGTKIEELEEEVLAKPKPGTIQKIDRYKRELNFLRKSIRPAKEMILQISRLDTPLISSAVFPFVRDLQDLTIQATDAIETYREILSDQLNIYNSVLSNRMNEIMKVLTIFAAIFIPLTFIAGIYGTNFEYLPELKYKYSYFIFWGVMIVVASSMLVYFRKKEWL